MAPAAPDPADALYALPPNEFTAARDRLAADLRKQGKRDEASAIKALAKPTVSAWAVNQAVRRSPSLLEALFAATDDLVRAQASAGATAEGRARYRLALEAQHRAVEGAVAAARAALEEAGLASGPAVLDRVANDLRWGAASDDSRALLRAGRLAKDLEPQALEAVLGLFQATPLAPTPARDLPAAGPAEVRPANDGGAEAPAAKKQVEAHPRGGERGAEARARGEEERARATERERARREREARRDALEGERRAARRAVEHARAELARHEAAAGRAQARLEDLRATLARAQREAMATEGQREAARAALADKEANEAALTKALDELGNDDPL